MPGKSTSEREARQSGVAMSRAIRLIDSRARHTQPAAFVGMSMEWAGDHAPQRGRQGRHRGADAIAEVRGRRVRGHRRGRGLMGTSATDDGDIGSPETLVTETKHWMGVDDVDGSTNQRGDHVGPVLRCRVRTTAPGAVLDRLKDLVERSQNRPPVVGSARRTTRSLRSRAWCRSRPLADSTLRRRHRRGAVGCPRRLPGLPVDRYAWHLDERLSMA